MRSARMILPGATSVLCTSVALVALLPAFARADCHAQLSGWLRQVEPGRQAVVDAETCAGWPGSPGMSVVVWALDSRRQGAPGARPLNASDGTQVDAADASARATADRQDGDSPVELDDLAIAVADVRTNQLLAYRVEHGAVPRGDGDNGLVSVAIDAARYPLTPAQAAFGVRVESSEKNGSRAHGEIRLSLYVVDGHRLRPVLTSLPVDVVESSGTDSCNASFDETTRTITLPASLQGDHAPLAIVEWKTHAASSSRIVHTGCVVSSSPAQRSDSVLDYRDGRYTVPGT